MEDLKFPLSKKNKDQFVKDYELIFLNKPANSLKEQKLVELVNANRHKITPNAKTTEPNADEQEQEGIQNEEGENGAIADGSGKPLDGQGSEILNEGQEIVGDGSGEKLPEVSATEQIASDLKNGEFNGVKPELTKEQQEERDLQLRRHKLFFGTEAEESWTTEQIERLNTSKVYFDLFGKFPLEEMTIEQIFSAIENEKNRQDKAKAAAEKSFVPVVSEFDYDPETEMLIVKKSDPKDKRIVNKNTFQFLKGDYNEVSEIPKELKNR